MKYAPPLSCRSRTSGSCCTAAAARCAPSWNAITMADQPRGADLAGQVALVTGAASGIGRGSAVAFAAAGASVALIDIDQCGLEATATEIRDAGVDALTLAADVTDLQAITAAVDRIVAQ